MKKNVTRRDFCNGVIIGTGVNVLSPLNLFGQSDLLTHELGASISNYPPMLNGMRGSHQGSFEVAHALAWAGQKPSSYKELNEEYDLVIVGAGISGLATAWIYQQKMGQDARILLLDKHDDFEGTTEDFGESSLTCHCILECIPILFGKRYLLDFSNANNPEKTKI